jgi:hypothetical protein
MPKMKRCILCGMMIDYARSQHNQTRYCLACAKKRKRENSLDPWTPEERRAYMREYMRRYRRSQNRQTAVEGVA